MATRENDYCSTIVCAYIVYLLLCLKDPSKYYGKPSGDAIDIVNIATNAEQARNVFFKGFKKRITSCPWFAGKFSPTANAIEFDKSVTVHSGHSEREAFEGLNLIVAVLDEISGFALESTSGHDQAKTADAVYKMYRASVDSRFPEFGKVLLLSFPRFENDYIMQRYNAAVATKEIIYRKHTFKIDPDLPDNIDGNEFEIEWEEDHILRYTYPHLYALRRPSWEVNPTVSLDSPAMVRAFSEDPGDALGRFACMPSNLSSGYFKNKARIDDSFILQNGVDVDGVFLEKFNPKENAKYFLHVDLAQKHDHCAVAIAHVEKWVQVKIGSSFLETHPQVVVDAVRWWTPTKTQSVDFADVRDFIISIRRRGFDIQLVTFDRWNCLLGTSLIPTPNGPVRIKDISVGDEVYTRHGIAKVGGKRNSGRQEVFRLTTRLGHEFSATKNHKTLTRRGWVEIQDVGTDDELIMDNSFTHFVGKETMTEGQAYALGGLIADGWVGHKKDQMISFTTADKCFYDAVNDGLIEWGFKNKVQKTLQNKTLGSRVDTHTYSYWDKAMVSRLRDAGLTRAIAHDKTIPNDVLQGTRAVRAAFLAGYIDGDGGIRSYIDKSGQTRYRLTIDTSSERLIEELVWLTMSLGIESTRLRQRRSNPDREVHRLTFEGKKAERLLAVVKPKISRKSSISLTEKRGGKERWTFVDNQLWLKVNKIESIGIQETFDITVPEYEEFIADGFVTHNSADTMNILETNGINTDTLSVSTKHYDDFLSVMYDGRLLGPNIELLKDELGQLRLIRGKVDHPRKGSKDLSDAVCGAIYNAVAHTSKPRNVEAEVLTYSRLLAQQAPPPTKPADGVIRPPSIPPELKGYLDRMRVL